MINVRKGFVYINDLNRATVKMQRQFADKENDEHITSLPIQELNEIVYDAEKIALSCRKAIEEKECEEEDYFDKNYQRISTQNIPVTVMYINGILRIKTPLTFKRMFHKESLKGNYLLMNYVDIALQEYIEKNGPLFEKVDAPFVAIIKRVSNTYNQNNICDNDNIENGRIINRIASIIGHSDNPMLMDIYSCFRMCKQEEEIGTEFIFTSYDKFKLIVNELDRVA